MLITTKGIVLKHFKYAENSIIAKIYTQDFGLQSFIVRGVRSGKSKNKASYLQALSMVEITASYQEKKSLHTVKTIQLQHPYSDIPFNIVKTSLAFFIAEVLLKAIKEEENNQQLYDFLIHSLQFLDLTKESCANFHLLFMAQLSTYLGIQPQQPISLSNPVYFDLQEGVFLSHIPGHKQFLDTDKSTLLNQLYNTKYNQEGLKLNPALRKSLLGVLLDYYHLHLSNFDNLKSLRVLEEVLN